MKSLFAELARTQLSVNRLRSFWTLVAIVLATALTTCVTHFVASGYAMLTDWFGADFGIYGAAYQATLVIPAAVLCAFIVVMAVVVISNAFRISAQARTAEFGILKCVGATPAQIRAVMLWEAGLLSFIAIPIGLAAGLALTAAAVHVTNGYFGELNALTHIMLKKMTFTLPFVVSWKALLASALLSLSTVLASAWLPARKAARLAAIESVRGQGARPMLPASAKQRVGDGWVLRAFGAEGLLARQTLARNRRSFRTTVVSLTVAIVLFIFIGFLVQQGRAFTGYMFIDSGRNVTADYQSSRSEDSADYAAPITSSEGDAITQALAAYDGGTDVFGMGNDYTRYDVTLPASALTSAVRDYYEETGKTATFDVECIVLDSVHYEALCKRAGVPVGSTLLINNDRLNLKGHATDMPVFNEKPEALALIEADGSETRVEIAAMLTADETPQELFYPNTNPVRLILPEMTLRQYDWQAATDDSEGFMAYAEDVLAAHFPDQSDETYMENGYTSRVYLTDDYIRVMNIAIMLALVLLACFCGMLALIGFTNVASTLLTNVLLRTSEFAVLESVGMTPGGLRKMLAFESTFCALRALIFGVPLGLGLTWLVNLPIRQMFPVPYVLPWQAVLLVSGGVLIVTLAITALAVRRQGGRSLVEMIRAGGRLY